jgi:hypothetical protein
MQLMSIRNIAPNRRICYRHRMSRIALAVFMLLSALIAPAMAQTPADGPDLPRHDPPGMWHRVTPSDDTTDSKCIGNPVTPICAIETYFACFVRLQPELCRLVNAGVEPISSDSGAVLHWTEYRVVYARRPSKLNPVEPATEGRLKPQPGDILIGVMQRSCFVSYTNPNCEIGVENEPLGVFMTRKVDGYWTNPYFFRPRF